MELLLLLLLLSQLTAAAHHEVVVQPWLKPGHGQRIAVVAITAEASRVHLQIGESRHACAANLRPAVSGTALGAFHGVALDVDELGAVVEIALARASANVHHGHGDANGGGHYFCGLGGPGLLRWWWSAVGCGAVACGACAGCREGVGRWVAESRGSELEGLDARLVVVVADCVQPGET